VAPGIDAVVRVPELPGREFPGKVTRLADALQPGTRTLLTEIDIPNPDGALSPGIYCTIEFHIPRKTPSLSVPADAIIFNRNGMQVAVVRNGKAEIRKVGVKRDLGTRVEVDTGIEAGDQVILNPWVTLVDGSMVQIRQSAGFVQAVFEARRQAARQRGGFGDKSVSQWTLRWRKTDSNHRSRCRKAQRHADFRAPQPLKLKRNGGARGRALSSGAAQCSSNMVEDTKREGPCARYERRRLSCGGQAVVPLAP
jgi:hypothetical protein